jgi:hypothetical protein
MRSLALGVKRYYPTVQFSQALLQFVFLSTAACAGQPPAPSPADDSTPEIPSHSRSRAKNHVQVPQGFSAIPLESAGSRQCFQADWGQLDNAGGLELAVAHFNQANEVFALEQGRLVLKWTDPHTEPSQGIAWGDFDGDGDDDLAIANMGAPNRVYQNQDGNLHLLWSESDATESKDVLWGDVNGDGLLDLVFANAGPNRIYLGEGKSFRLSFQGLPEDETDSLALADFDQDGDLDLAVANSGQPTQDRLLHGSPKGFQDPRAFGPMEQSSSVAWVDVDGDGQLELAIARPSSADSILRLLPSETPHTTYQGGEHTHTREVTAADLNGDGRDALLWAVEGALHLQEFGPDGAKTLGFFAQESLTEGVDFGDADGDGDLDLAVCNRNGDLALEIGAAGGAPVQVYLYEAPQP